MKLTDICVSLDLARKLREVGFQQETLSYWEVMAWNEPELPTDKPIINLVGGDRKIQSKGKYSSVTYYAAPTAGELAEEFRLYEKLYLTIQVVNKFFRVGYMNDHGFWESPNRHSIRNWYQDDSLQEALAELYLDLFES